MPQNVFKIYDGRNNFWQWDTKQKLIILDDTITQVHFSNKNMSHSIKRYVYVDDKGLRVCNVPSTLLQMPKNLVAYAYAESHTVKSVKFAVVQRPIPADYIADQDEEIENINRRLDLLEAMLKDIEAGNQELKKFENIEDAERWAKEAQSAGAIVAIRLNSKWIAHIVEDDYSVTPICSCNGQMVEINVFDGGDGDGYDEIEMVEVRCWDGGGAAGII